MVMRGVRFLGHVLLMCGLLAGSVGCYVLLAWLLILVMGWFGVRVSWAAATVAALLPVTACLVPWMLWEMRRAPCMDDGEVCDDRR